MKKTTSQFISDAKKIHSERYDYSMVSYTNANTKVKIVCPIHGEFLQKPSNHLMGQGCPVCSGKIRKTTSEFISDAVKIHGERYDYSMVDYVNAKTKIQIKCLKCGNSFFQKPNNHLMGQGCPTCGQETISSKLSDTKSQFIEKSKKVHSDFYDYSMVSYTNSSTKVKIVCPIHGEFEQTPSNHLSGKGCPICGQEKAARKISKTLEEFISDARKVHGDKYEYYEYVNDSIKIKIKCLNCGNSFFQKPNNHLRGQGCPVCKASKPTKTTDKFISEAKLVHFEKYDYSLVDYKNCDTKVKIICLKCGNVFLQTPSSHLSGRGCPVCKASKPTKTTDKFISEANLVHNDFYDYSMTNYVNNQTKVKIICPTHGEFLQKPYSHLNGNGCPECGKEKISKALLKTTDEFISEAKLVHNNKYDYSLVSYKGIDSKVKIICPIHGEFLQTPHDHLSGSGCFACSESKGEKAVAKFLTENNIEFERQKKFKNCKYKNLLPFDFYIPSRNTCIEFDGIQHFEPIEAFGGEAEFEIVKIRDKIKTDYCLSKNIKLVRIRYDQEISQVLNHLTIPTSVLTSS